MIPNSRQGYACCISRSVSVHAQQYVRTHVKSSFLCTSSVMLLRHSMRVHVEEELVGCPAGKLGSLSVVIKFYQCALSLDRL